MTQTQKATPIEIEEYRKKSAQELVEKHQQRVQEFMKNNPGRKLPIHFDKDGEAIWMNRAMRRKKR